MPEVAPYAVMIGDPPVEVGEIRAGTVQSRVGRLREISHFRYSAGWLRNPERFALSPTLPLSEQWQHFAESPEDRRSAMPGVFRDAAPDSWGRSIIARNTGASTEMEFLLAVDDRTRLGALRFADSGGAMLSATEPPVPRLTDLRRLHRLCAAMETGTGDLRAIARDQGQPVAGAGVEVGGLRVCADRLVLGVPNRCWWGSERRVWGEDMG